MPTLRYLLLLIFLSTPEQTETTYCYAKSCQESTGADLSIAREKNTPSEFMTHFLFDDCNVPVKKMLTHTTKKSHKMEAYSDICSNASFDFPHDAKFLIETKIDVLSLTPDTVIPFLIRYTR